MPSIADLFITVSSDVTGAIGGLTAVDQKINGLDPAMKNATAAALPLAAAAGAIGAGFLSAIDEAATFEAQISGIKAVLSPDEIVVYGDAIEDLALRLGRDTTFSAQEAAKAIEELVKAGVPIETVLGGGAKAATDLAAATGFDLARSAEFAATALNTFHVPAEDLDRVVNHLSGTVNASSADMNGLQFAFQAVGPVAATLGISFYDTATALGIFADNGLKGSDAGTSLKTMLLNLQPTTKAQVGAFQELGLYTTDTEKGMAILTERLSQTEAGQKVLTKAQSDGVVSFEELFKAANALNPALVDGAKDSDTFARSMGLTSNAFFDANGNAKPLNEIFGILKESTTGLTAQQKLLALETAFGADAVRAAAIAADVGAEGFDELTAAISKIDADDAARTRLDNLKGAQEQLNGSWETVQITIGQLLLPAVRALVEGLTGLLNGFLTLDPGVQGFIVAALGVAGAVAGIVAAMVLLAPLWGAVTAGFGLIVAAASPVILPILAIVAAIAALKLAWDTDFAGIQGVTAEVWTAIQPLFENIAGLFSRVMEMLGPFVAAFQGELPGAMAAFSNAVAPLLAQLPNLIRLIGDFWNAVSAIIQLLAAGDFSGAWDMLVSSVASAGDRIGPALENIGRAIGDWLANAIPAIIAAAPDVWKAFIDQAWELGTRIGEAFGNLLQFIGDQLGAAIPNLISALPDPWEPFVRGAWEIGTRIAEAFGNFMAFIGQTIAAIPALIEGIGDFFGPLIAAAWAIGTRIAEAFGNFLGFIGEQLAGIPDMITGLGDFFGPLIAAAWEIGQRIAEAFENFINFIGGAIGGIPGLIEGLGDIFGPLVAAAWAVGQPVADAIMNVVGFIGNAIAGIPAFLESLGDPFQWLVTAAQALYGNIAAAIEPIKDLLANTFGNFWQWLTGATALPEAPAGGGTGGTGGVPTTAPTGPLISIGTMVVSSESDAQAFLQLVADAVLASARRVTPPLSGANPAL